MPDREVGRRGQAAEVPALLELLEDLPPDEPVFAESDFEEPEEPEEPEELLSDEPLPEDDEAEEDDEAPSLLLLDEESEESEDPPDAPEELRLSLR
jgi:hypothetical protein